MMSRDELTADEFPIFQPARIDIERQLTCTSFTLWVPVLIS